MPELGIIVVILLAALWLLVKILQAVGGGINKILNTSSDLIQHSLRDRYHAKKDKLSKHIRFFLPVQLIPARNELDKIKTRFQEHKTKTWKAYRPNWGNYILGSHV
jgi:hypothetical protein